MPDVKMRDREGQTINFQEIETSKRRVLILYRGGWCPYCNSHIRHIQEKISSFEAQGIVPIFVSVDSPASAKETVDKYQISFPILSDSKLELHRRFGLLNQLGEAQLKRLRLIGMDIESASGEQHHTIAHPGVFYINENKTVVWGSVNEDYKVRPNAEKIMKIAKTLNW